jgi:endoglucanase
VVNKPDDPLKQIAAVWHAYPNSGTVGDPKAAEPKFGKVAYQWTQSVLDAGYPVVISEFGDHNAPGTRGAPFLSQLLPWADTAGASYLGWTWNVWQDKDNVLIKDGSGSPSDGYGDYVKRHLTCVSEGKTPCP